MTMTRLIFPVLLVVAFRPQAQTPSGISSSEIFQQIKKLKVLGSVLYFAAHPDDENTRLITWLSKDQLLKTGYLSLTRGDGGQNLIGDEQGVELGLIRTQELLSARRIDGGEQFFSRAFDFGFSKSTEEALRIWGKDKVLSDAVWVIRKFQPDVIITRFPPDARAGHGHHSASAVVAQEAFKAAADPKMFPDQFKYGVRPWQAKRIVWNGYNFDASDAKDAGKLNIDAGGYNPLIGKSYGEIAAESRSQHKTQGFGVAPVRGSVIENFSHTDGTPAKNTLTEGIDLTWNRVGAPAIASAIDSILQGFRLTSPAASVPSLIALFQKIKSLPAGGWRTEKMEDVQQIIEEASGIWIDAYGTDPTIKQGGALPLNFVVISRENIPVRFDSVRTEGFDTAVNQVCSSNKGIIISTVLQVPANHPVSQPYWLKEKMSDGSYNVNEQALIGLPDALPAYRALFRLRIGGTPFDFEIPVRYRHTDPVKGEVYEPLVVVPSAANATKYGTLRHIHYDHIPDIYYFQTDTASITLHDVKTVGKKIGYIEGAGDKVPAALALMGYDVTILKEKDLTPSYLAQFDAVITGVRAYNVHSYLFDKNDILKQYVENGGNFIVQYNVNGFETNSPLSMGPYPFQITRNRITDEHAPVKFLLPAHQVLNFPNHITAGDFENWKQERTIYSAERLDAAFQAPLSMSDPGEDPQTGSLIIAKYGKGTFVYTGIVFFRELPAGVNGAYRLLANIIALNKKP